MWFILTLKRLISDFLYLIIVFKQSSHSLIYVAVVIDLLKSNKNTFFVKTQVNIVAELLNIVWPQPDAFHFLLPSLGSVRFGSTRYGTAPLVSVTPKLWNHWTRPITVYRMCVINACWKHVFAYDIGNGSFWSQKEEFLQEITTQILEDWILICMKVKWLVNR